MSPDAITDSMVRDALDATDAGGVSNNGVIIIDGIVDLSSGPGWVYFVRSGQAVKIGWSKSLARRAKALQTGNADTLTFLGIMAGGRLLERQTHATFRRHRLNGEWFEYPPIASQIRAMIRVRGYGIAEEPRTITKPAQHRVRAAANKYRIDNGL